MAGFYDDDDLALKSKGTHGSCQFLYATPELERASLNLSLTFEEALKLSCALQSALLDINGKNRATAKGKALGVQLSVKRDRNQIAVITRPVTASRRSTAAGVSSEETVS